MGLAHVYRTDPNSEAARFRDVHDVTADLSDQLLLNLEPGAEVIDDPVVLGQADDLAIRRGHHSDIGLAVDRHQVMRTHRSDFDGSDNDELIVSLNVLELGVLRRGTVTA